MNRVGNRKRITSLRALYWLEFLANKKPSDLSSYDLDKLRDDLRSHVEVDLTAKRRRASRG